jgi:hypothetical protein
MNMASLFRRSHFLRAVHLNLVWLALLGSCCLPSQATLHGQDAAFDAERMQSLQLTSKAFRAAAAKIRPALVTIESFGGVSAVQGKIGGIRQQGEGNTTGVMISPD